MWDWGDGGRVMVTSLNSITSPQPPHLTELTSSSSHHSAHLTTQLTPPHSPHSTYLPLNLPHPTHFTQLGTQHVDFTRLTPSPHPIHFTQLTSLNSPDSIRLTPLTLPNWLPTQPQPASSNHPQLASQPASQPTSKPSMQPGSPAS